MTKLYVKEFAGVSSVNLDGAIESFPVDNSPADQVVDFTAGAAASAAFAKATQFIQLAADAPCSIAFGTNPTATTANFRLPGGVVKTFSVPQGKDWKVSAITNP